VRITNTGLLLNDESRSTPGYVLTSTIESDRAYLLDPDANVAHEWHVKGGMTNWCYLLPNGNLFINERCENRKGVALTVSGRLSEYDKNSQLVWQHDDPYQHHDCRRLPNGAIYAAFSEPTEHLIANLQGGIPGTETPGGPFGEVIREVNENGDTVWEWYYEQLDLATHPLHRNANRWSYGHTNTVCPLKDGNYLISSKNLCMLFIIDRQTNNVIWEYQDDQLNGQHDAQMLDNGNILVFANGAYMPDLHHSQVWEIDPRTNTTVWKYIAKDDFTSFFSPHMSGAQRLPTGNTLICEGNKGCIFEVTPEGDIVREYVNPFFFKTDIFGNTNWLFRARWYAADAPEVVNLLNN